MFQNMGVIERINVLSLDQSNIQGLAYSLNGKIAKHFAILQNV